MNNKGDVAVLALVILTVILFGSSLFVFHTNSSKIIGEINDARAINNIYIKEQQIDFYLNEVIDRSLKNSFDKNSFISEMKQNLKLYDKEDILVRENLMRIAEGVNENSVIFEKEIILNVEEQIVSKKDKIIISFSYNKKFVREAKAF